MASLKARQVVAGWMLAAMGCVAAATSALAQGDAAGFPKQPIRLIVGFAAGGGNDFIARVVAAKLSERLGQPAVVENRPGAGANIAAEAVARATPDGHTLLVAPPSTCCINPAVYSKLPYDPLGSFEYITVLATFPFLLTVSAASPHTDVKGLVAWAKANPKHANYASTSAFFQLFNELFKMRTGAPFEHIPFKGSNEMLAAILSGQVTMAFVDAGPLMGQLKAGKARALATASPGRISDLPDVPTLAEAGVPDVTIEGWSGLAAPKGTPRTIVDKLASEVTSIVALQDVREKFASHGVWPAGGTADQFRARVERDLAMWKDVAGKAKIKLD